ncbi:MAG: Wzz/FepE/Etk N-terminal domain-containing protein, partial [Prolixibacteraceae bacterium]|nr:Wzz/FepE/Etk N-terminal domain-containing protein [Prolixibacteraceae bacterium]
HTEEDEIDLLALAKQLWNGRKTIIRALIIGAIVGVFVALVSPKEYTVSTSLVPQVSEGKSTSLGGLSGLASMAGIDLSSMNSGQSVISPITFPKIVQSTPYQLELMNKPIRFDDVEEPVSLYTYYTEISTPGILSLVKKYTLRLPGVILKAILKAIRGEDEETTDEEVTSSTITLTNEEQSLRKMLSGALTLTVNEKEGTLSLQAKLPEAKAAADLAQHALELLQKYITQYKIEKAKDNLQFVRELYHEKKQEFEAAQSALAAYRDRNKNITSAMARTEEQRLESEYNIAFNVYSELAKQLEQARIKVKEDTPVFSVIEPVVVPRVRSKPQRTMILIIWLFLAGITGVGIIFVRHYLPELKKRWNETE